MDDTRSFRGTLLAVVLLLLVISSASYVGAYLLLSAKSEYFEFSIGPPFMIRRVSQQWMIPFFKPLAEAESLFSDEHVYLTVPDENGWISYPPMK